MEISNHKYQRLLYRSRVGQGICTDCGKQKAAQGIRVCRHCQIKRSEQYYRKKEGYAHERHPNGVVDFSAVYTGLGTVSEVEK